MKLEYIAEGSPDCPLIRIYDFDLREAADFKSLLEELRDDPGKVVKIHELPNVESVNNCRFTFKSALRDLGITLTGPLEFECTLTSEAWDDLVLWVEPFCNSSQGAYQWLDTRGRRKFNLLFSRNGQW